MAIYHLNAQIISRSHGKSVVAAAAYRSGGKLEDKRLGETFDYTKKSGVDATIILAPDNAPDWVYNRERLWNIVEAVERRKDSQLAREFNIALPRELDRMQMQDLALGYVQEQFVARGMVADVAFHHLDAPNPHFHVLLTMRYITKEGLGKKNRAWDTRELLIEQREAWANHVNQALECAGYAEEKVDHRTLVAQGITDRIAQVHLGPELHHLRQRYIEEGNLQEFRDKYVLGDLYETINELNRQLAENSQEIAAELQEQSKSPPQVQNRFMNYNDPTEEPNRDRERENTPESFLLTERLQGLADDLRSSGEAAEALGRERRSLARRIRGDGSEVREPGRTHRGTGKLSTEAPQGSGEETREQSPSLGQSAQGFEKVSDKGFGVSQNRDSSQLKPVQPELSGDLGGCTEGEAVNPRDTGDGDRTILPAQTGGSGFASPRAADLELDPIAPTTGEPVGANQGEGKQYRNQAQSTGETTLNEQQNQFNRQNQAILRILFRLLEAMKARLQVKGKWITFQGERYTVRLDTDSQTLELHANDGRGLILSGSHGQISSQLSPSDIEHLNRIDWQLGQRQVDCCFPVLVRYLEALGRYRDESTEYLIELDSSSQTLTYRSFDHPENFLVAKITEEVWQYVEGQLTPEQEEVITVDFENWLGEWEREREREQDRGFEL
jgi:hypothetical protein